MENNEHIDNYLHDKLDGYVAAPNITSFEQVLKKMEQRKKRRFFFILFPGLGLLVGAFMAYAFFYNPVTPATAVNHTTALNSTHKKTNPIKINEPALPSKQLTGHAPEKIQPQHISSINTPVKTGSVVNAKSNYTAPAATKTKTPVFVVKKQAAKTNSTASANTNETYALAEPAVEKNPEQTISVKPNTVILSESNTSTTTPPDSLTSLPVITSNAKHEATLMADTTLIFQDTPPLIIRDSVTAIKLALNDTLTNKKPLKKNMFYLGISGLPQLGSSFITETYVNNPTANKKYRAPVRFNYGIALKLGVNVNNTWEFFAGFGYQVYHEAIKVAVPAGTVYNYAYAISPALAKTILYKYLAWHLEAGRLITLNKIYKIKPGIGIQGNYLLNSSYYSPETTRKNVYNANAKLGFITELGPKLQLQFGPNLFYAVNSTFKKNNEVKQNRFGLALEALLLFKIK